MTGALVEKVPEGLDLLLGLGMQAFPIDKAIVERGIADALDHLTGKFGLLVQHPYRNVDALLDAVGLSLEKLRRAKAVPDMAAVVL